MLQLGLWLILNHLLSCGATEYLARIRFLSLISSWWKKFNMCSYIFRHCRCSIQTGESFLWIHMLFHCFQRLLLSVCEQKNISILLVSTTPNAKGLSYCRQTWIFFQTTHSVMALRRNGARQNSELGTSKRNQLESKIEIFQVPCPFFSASSASGRTRTPRPPRPNLAVNWKRNVES